MSFGRWSLPGRANNSTTTPNQLVKFPTVNFSQPRLRQSHVSSVFASEKDRDDLSACLPSIPKETFSTQTASENIPPSDTSPTGSPLTTRKGHGAKPHVSSPPSRSRVLAPLRLVSSLGQHLYQAEEDKQDGNKATIEEKKGLSDLVPTSASASILEKPDPARLSPSPARVQSSASSYPSEGIRSPNGGSSSPEPTTVTRNLVSDLTRLAALPDDHPWFTSLASIHSDQSRNITNMPYSPSDSHVLSDWETRPLDSKLNYSRDSPSRTANDPRREHPSIFAGERILRDTMPYAEKREQDASSSTTSSTGSEETINISSPRAARSLSVDQVSTAVDSCSRQSLLLRRVSAREQSCSDAMVSIQGIAPDSAIAKSGTTSLEITPKPQLEKPQADEAMIIPTRGAQRLKLRRWIRRLYQRTRARFGRSSKNKDSSCAMENSAPIALERRGNNRHSKSKAPTLRFWKSANLARNTALQTSHGRKQSDEGLILLNESGLESRLAIMSLRPSE